MTALRDVFILEGYRTAIGRERGLFNRLGAYELGAAVLRPLREPREGTGSVGQVVMANAVNGGNVARVAALAAGLPASVPALTINAQCSGGLAAVRLAAQAVRMGDVQYAIGGGIESLSRARVAVGAERARGHDHHGLPRVSHAPPPFADPDMGPAADMLAARLGIGRDAQDAYALESYRRTLQARDSGFFDPLVVPVLGLDPANTLVDESPRRVPRADHLQRYPPAFSPTGTVTVGNAAAVGDAAAAVLVGSRPAANADRPPVRIVSASSAAGDPDAPALAVLTVIEGILTRTGISPAQIDRWEINEAFAVKILACIDHFALDPAVVNVSGGAIAYGHPFSASGAILLVHLVEELHRSGTRYGLAAVAGAGGIAEAMLLERLDT